MGRWALGAFLAAALVRPATAQTVKPETLWALPDSTVAFCAFDGAALGEEGDRARALVAAAVRGLLSNVAMVENGSAVADELLRARALGRASWRVCLLELEGETKEIKRGPRQTDRVVRPAKFGAVIEVFASREGGGHDRLLAAVEAGLGRDSSLDKSPRQRTSLRLSDGATGGLSSAEEEWRDVSWVSRPGSLVVAFGRGVIEKWPARGRGGAWAEHRRAVGGVRGEIVLEAFVDLNALRRGVPDEFEGGGLDRLVHAWRIANDRSVMFHGRLIGEKDDGARMLLLQATWSSRAEKPGEVRAMALSEAAWPEAIGERPKDGWAVVLKPDATMWLTFGLDTYQALGPTGFDVVRTRWERRAAPILERISPRLGEWMVVKPGLELTLSLQEAKGMDRLAADMRAVMSSLAPSVAASGKGWGLNAAEAEKELQGLVWKVREDGGAIVTEWVETKR